MQLLEALIFRYPALDECKTTILKSYDLLAKSFEQGHSLYVCGNGGSAADALHIVGELAKSFVKKRELDKSFCEAADNAELVSNLQGALPTFALVENSALSSAYANDCNPNYVFAQQVYAYTRRGDCLLGISTSGNSTNVVNACETAKTRGAVTIGLSGANGGKLKNICDVCICVPESETYKIQELHLPVYHTLCMMLEDYFWGDEGVWKR